jgi:uncharacterized protein with HEPN domain
VKRPHPERVDDYLGHIAEAITRATDYIRRMNIEEFEKNPLVQDAVVRNIEIIGEAVSHITRTAPGFTDQHPEVPWAQMRAMRNVVIHQYFSVDLKILWTTATEDLPRLKQQIDRLLGEQRGAAQRESDPDT